MRLRWHISVLKVIPNSEAISVVDFKLPDGSESTLFDYDLVQLR